jgi:hypothetical protein
MDYSALNTLIKTHPNYATVSDEDLTAWVNEEAISVDKATLPATTILSTILTYKSEWDALSEANKATVRDILYIASGEGVPTAAGNPIRTVLVNILGTQTKQALGAAIVELVSRAVTAGILGKVRVADVEYARTL